MEDYRQMETIARLRAQDPDILNPIPAKKVAKLFSQNLDFQEDEELFLAYLEMVTKQKARDVRYLIRTTQRLKEEASESAKMQGITLSEFITRAIIKAIIGVKGDKWTVED